MPDGEWSTEISDKTSGAESRHFGSLSSGLEATMASSRHGFFACSCSSSFSSNAIVKEEDEDE